MKKTCKNCYYGGNGRHNMKTTVACQKLGKRVKVDKDRQGCMYWRSDPPRERPHLSYYDVMRGMIR